MITDILKEKGYLTLGSRMRRIGERLQAETQKVMDHHGAPIQAAQYPILAALDENGPLSVNDLTKALVVKQPGVTRTVRQLEEQGLLTVRQNETDLRVRLVSLTDTGQSVVDHGRHTVWPLIAGCVAQIMEDAPDGLLDQLDHLEAGLEKTPFLNRLKQLEEDIEDGRHIA